MSSDQQIAANRLNAQSSTGPRTLAGKAKVSMNSLKHGLTGRQVVLPSENPDDFESFRADLLTSLDPRGALEAAWAEMIVADFWRRRRVPILEAALYRRGCEVLLVRQAAAEVQQYESSAQDVTELLMAERDVQPHRDAKQRLASASAKLDDLWFNVALLLETSPGLSTLERPEAALSRSLQRMLHELERLQARRAGEHVPVPVTVDVDVSLSEPSRQSSETDGITGRESGD